MDIEYEYGLFNVLPEGKTLEDIPSVYTWMYQFPFSTGPSKEKMQKCADQINDIRIKRFKSGYMPEPINTLCEVRERTITHSDWVKSEDS